MTQCAQPGCKKAAAGLSNYCSEHQVGGNEWLQRNRPEPDKKDPKDGKNEARGPRLEPIPTVPVKRTRD